MTNLQELCQLNTEFGVDLYKKLSESDPNSNIFFSPMSISVALAMTSLGAKGNIETEMKSVLKFDKISGEVHVLFKQLMNHFLVTNGNYTLLLANKLYGEKSNEFLVNFLDNCKENYGPGLESVDFKNKAKECESLINKWVEHQTKDRIKNLIPIGTLNELTQLVLVNAIYFKGCWKTPFKEVDTTEDKFHVNENQILNVPFMHFYKEKFKYYYNDDLSCQVLELPYLGRTLSFIVILPDLTKTDLHKVELKLTGLTLQNISNKFENCDVNISLPKFKLESEPELMTKLKELGMIDLFLPGKADLSNMNGATNLYVSSLLHKAFIEVNEQGSEAAAATAVVVSLECAMLNEPDPVNFNANHPFIFLIKDNRVGTLLFMGKFMMP